MTHEHKRFGLFKAGLATMVVLGLTACGSGFQEGAYVDPRYGTTYEFNKGGQGRLIGGIPDEPTFTYTVSRKEVTMTGEVTLVFKRIDKKNT